MDDIFDKIIRFVIAERWEYDFPLSRETTLQKDLQIYGDDADEFILSFSKKFNVDVSKFSIKEYFEPEGDQISLSIWRLFRKGRKTIKLLTVGDLEQAAIKGKLE